MFLHWVIDPTLHPGPWRWGDYRDERERKVRETEGAICGDRRGGVRKVSEEDFKEEINGKS